MSIFSKSVRYALLARLSATLMKLRSGHVLVPEPNESAIYLTKAYVHLRESVAKESIVEVAYASRILLSLAQSDDPVAAALSHLGGYIITLQHFNRSNKPSLRHLWIIHSLTEALFQFQYYTYGWPILWPDILPAEQCQKYAISLYQIVYSSATLLRLDEAVNEADHSINRSILILRLHCLFTLLRLEFLAYSLIRVHNSISHSMVFLNRLNERFKGYLLYSLQSMGFRVHDNDVESALWAFLEQPPAMLLDRISEYEAGLRKDVRNVQEQQPNPHPRGTFLPYVVCGILALRAIVNHEVSTSPHRWMGKAAIDKIIMMWEPPKVDQLINSAHTCREVNSMWFACFWGRLLCAQPVFGECTSCNGRFMIFSCQIDLVSRGTPEI